MDSQYRLFDNIYKILHLFILFLTKYIYNEINKIIRKADEGLARTQKK